MVVEQKLGKGMISESWEYYLKNIALFIGVVLDTGNRIILPLLLG